MATTTVLLLASVCLAYTITGLLAQTLPPVFSQNVYQASLAETAVAHGSPRPTDSFLNLTCNVSEQAMNVLYSISGDTWPFEIDPDTGALSVIADLDYENVTSYMFRVNCADKSDAHLSDSATVSITIEPVNEFDPILPEGNSFTLSISESIPVGTTVKQFIVTDQDDGLGGNIIFTMDNPPTSSSPNVPRFSLGRSTGALVVTQSLDIDSLSTSSTTDAISFEITACDVDPPGPTCPNIRAIIFISGSNDNSPQFSQEIYQVSYPDTTTPIGTALLSASCTDADRGVGEFAGIEISSLSPNNSQMWDLEARNGTLVLQQRLEFSVSERHSITLRCSDTGTPVREDFATVIIIVENDPPVFTMAHYNATYSQGTAEGAVIAYFNCSDNEGELAGFELVNTSRAVEETFALNGTTGELTLRMHLDICKQARYEFTAVCLDTNNQMDSATVEVNVELGSFYFLRCTYTFEFDRFIVPNRNEEIGQVRAIGTGTIEYSLEENQFFVIDANSGKIYLSNYILYIQGSTFHLEVRANTGELSIISTVVINVRGLLSVLEVILIVAAAILLLIILLTCCCIFCCCCYFRCNTKVKDAKSKESSSDWRPPVTLPDTLVLESGLSDDHKDGSHKEHAKHAESSKTKETEEEEEDSSKFQAVAHVGAVMSGEEGKGETMQLRESKPGEKENSGFQTTLF